MKNEKPNTQTVSENVHVPMQNGKQCYLCGDDRHLIRFCPFRDKANSYARAPTYNAGAKRWLKNDRHRKIHASTENNLDKTNIRSKQQNSSKCNISTKIKQIWMCSIIRV